MLYSILNFSHRNVMMDRGVENFRILVAGTVGVLLMTTRVRFDNISEALCLSG